MTIIGQIWIGKVLIIWGLFVVIGAFPLFIALYWWDFVYGNLGTSHQLRVNKYGWCKLITIATLSLIALFVIFCIGAVFALPLCEIIFLSPIAYIMYQASHKKYVGGLTSILAKKSFDFILDNKSLYTSEKVIKRSYYNLSIIQRKCDKNENKNNDIDDTIYDTYDELNSRQILSKYKINPRVLNNKQEKLFRLAFINYCFLKFFKFQIDEKLLEYLGNDELLNNEWKGVTLQNIRNNSKSPKPGNFKSLVVLASLPICLTCICAVVLFVYYYN